MFCPKCGAEYKRGIIKCADCDVPLVEKLPDKPTHKKKEKHRRPDIKYKELLITFNAGEVAFVKSVLDNADIDYYFQGELFQMVRPFADPARLMVREDQVEEAMKLLKELDFGLMGPSAKQEEEME